MRWRQTDHRDGSKSFHLIPETPDEMAGLNLAFSTWPGGVKHDVETTEARIDVPVLSKDGQSWPDDMGVGDPKIRNGVFTRRLHLGHKETQG